MKYNWETPESNCFIYGLIDPRNQQLKYIGKTKRGKIRFNNHITEANQNKDNNKKNNWIRKLIKLNLIFDVVYLKYCNSDSELNEYEIFYEAYYKNLGIELLNTAPTGEKTYIHIHTEESKKLISIRTKLAMDNPEVRKKLRDSHIGQVSNNKGTKYTKEQLDNITKRNRETSGKKVIDSNGIIYPSVRNAAKILGMSVNTIKDSIYNKRKGRSTLTFKFYE